HAEPPEQQRARLATNMRWHAARIFLLACGPVFLPVAGLLWATRQPGEWLDGWLPPLLSLLISLQAFARLLVLARSPRREA
ncbi:hypothetical protein NL359_39295, partial [Klebsiella pneumoniae]|nr:hypothetical protein [Klebsiella pneumoniae]